MVNTNKDRRDIYYRNAKECGYRARSAYKLLQLNDQFNFLNNAKVVVDLCAAPGSWSQVVRKVLFEDKNEVSERDNEVCENPDGTIAASGTQTRIPIHLINLLDSSDSKAINDESLDDDKKLEKPIIVAVDLQEMAPIDDVHVIQGDITARGTLEKVKAILGDKLADVVLCDGAPDVTGMHEMDEYLQTQLLVLALDFTVGFLTPGGVFVAKIFKGECISYMQTQLHTLFYEVQTIKPTSSRDSSLEAFFVCRGFGMNPRLAIGEAEKKLFDVNLQEGNMAQIAQYYNERYSNIFLNSILQDCSASNNNLNYNCHFLAHRINCKSKMLNEGYSKNTSAGMNKKDLMIRSMIPFGACGDMDQLDYLLLEE